MKREGERRVWREREGEVVDRKGGSGFLREREMKWVCTEREVSSGIM